MAVGIKRTGTSRGETLRGSDNDDDLYGAGGADTLIGGAGDDILSAGGIYDESKRQWVADPVGDTLDGGDGNDMLYGDAGDDNLLGGNGADTLYGNGGADKLYGGDGDDILNSSGLRDYANNTWLPDDAGDLLDGGNGNDALYGGAGNDTLLGGAGKDTLSGSDGDDTLDGGSGDDTLFGGLGNDRLAGGDGDDILFGNEGNDTLDGGGGANELYGADGDDTYIVRSESDRIWDSSGNDSGVIHADWYRPDTSVEHWTWAEGVQHLPNWIAALATGPITGRVSGETTVKYYHFAEQPASFFSERDRDGFAPFTETQRAFMKKVFDYVSSVINIEFRETADPEAEGVVVIGSSAQVESAGYAGPNIFMLDNDASYLLNPTDDNYGALTFLHELGHTLGMKHPFGHADAVGGIADGPVLPHAEDTTAHTLMSYTSDPRDYRLFYSPYDIAALQYMYGPAASAAAGDDVYVLDPGKPAMIWDGGGNDTLDASALATDLTLDLRPGYWSDLGKRSDYILDAGQVTINFGTVIENLVGGSGDDTLTGNDAANVVRGGAGNDTLRGGAGSDLLDGGAGLDVASYAGKAAGFRLAAGAGGTEVADLATPADVDTLVGIERLRFDDTWVALDIDGVAGQAYRLYQAAFDRTPDAGGLGFWIARMDDGASLADVARAFIASPEWATAYGAALGHGELLTKLYQNILGRAPEQGGYDFWLGNLESGSVDTVTLLASFSESAENQQAVAEIIGNGFAYTPA